MAVSEESNRPTRRKLSAVSINESAHVDHASKEAVRPFILPTPRSSILDPSVISPLYRMFLRACTLRDLQNTLAVLRSSNLVPVVLRANYRGIDPLQFALSPLRHQLFVLANR